MTIKVKPPVWFWAVAMLLLLWSFAGAASLWMHMTYNPDDPANPAYDNQLYKSLPGWLNWVYAAAIGTTIGGAIALLVRHGVAVPLYAIALVAVVIQFGWTLGATDLIAVKGWGVAVGPVAVIVAFAVVGLWFARLSRGRGWIA